VLIYYNCKIVYKYLKVKMKYGISWISMGSFNNKYIWYIAFLKILIVQVILKWMKYVMDIFVINLIINSNESNMVTDMKNIESSIDFDSNNEVYNINNNSSVDKIVIVLMVKIWIIILVIVKIVLIT